ncbi:MAG: response regulator [Lachnospiraceae bacterium]|nr:response regulator [Lachnospiraceae bacterium]
MRYVSLSDVKVGQQLAFGIYDYHGKCLAELGDYIDNKIQFYLEDNGFRGVYIEDKETEEIRVNPIVFPKKRAVMMRDVLFCHIPECQEHAETIVQELKKSGDMQLDYLDPRGEKDYIYAHSVNVAIIAGVIGLKMGMPAKRVEQLILAALLHDVGRQRLPDNIGENRGRLSQEEYLTMKLHPSISVQMVREKGYVTEEVRNAILYHHENEDGSGYPDRLTTEKIPVFAKILHVADVYDALTSVRPHKGAYLPIEALEYLEGGAGISFYGPAVSALEDCVPEFPKGTGVFASDGMSGTVLKNIAESKGRPMIVTDKGEIINLSKQGFNNLLLTSIVEHAEYTIEENEVHRREMISGKRHFRLMIVDDQKTNLLLLKDILEEYYELTLLKSGEQAIDFIDNNTCPDLILMDINMPGMDGIQTATIIQQKTSYMVPILFVSSNNDLNTVLACRNLGCAGYIVRPYNSVYIKSAIKEILTGESGQIC